MVNLQKPPRGARINWADPITKGLVGCWLFNELTGDKVFDLANGNNGVLENGVIWKQGALYFDGSDDYVVTTFHTTDLSKGFSVFMKAKRKVVTKYPHIVSKWTSFFMGALDSSYNNDSIKFTIRVGGSGHDLIKDNVFPLDEDFSFCGTYDNNLQRIYKNGTEIASQSIGGAIDDTSNLLYIGRYEGGGADYQWGGELGVIYLYSRALTDDEIARLSAEPYSFLETPSSRAYFYVASGTTVSLDLGALSLTGYDISVQAGASVSMELGELALLGYDVSVQVGVNVIIAMESGAISLSGDDVVVNTGVTVSMELGELSFTGYDVNAGTAITVSIKITTTEAQAISGALVTIGDSFSETTDSNGEVSGNIVPGTYILTITKAGYQTYQAQIEITESIDWQIALNKQVGIIITGCGASVNLGPRNPTNVLYT